MPARMVTVTAMALKTLMLALRTAVVLQKGALDSVVPEMAKGDRVFHFGDAPPGGMSPGQCPLY